MKLKLQKILKTDKINNNNRSRTGEEGLPLTPKLGDETFEEILKD